jgi:hypothetical protein
MLISFTHIDRKTGIPLTEEPSKNGPVIPSIPGIVVTFADESKWPKPYPVFYGSCDDGADPATPGIISVLTQEEFDAAESAEMTARFDREKAERIKSVNRACDLGIRALVKSYPEHEISSWHQQVREATDYTLDNNAPTPLLSAIASGRGVTVPELVAKVHTKAAEYSAASGAIIGKRQALISLIETAETIDDILAVVW